jgi:hypothetical protein
MWSFYQFVIGEDLTGFGGGALIYKLWEIVSFVLKPSICNLRSIK